MKRFFDILIVLVLISSGSAFAGFQGPGPQGSGGGGGVACPPGPSDPDQVQNQDQGQVQGQGQKQAAYGGVGISRVTYSPYSYSYSEYDERANNIQPYYPSPPWQMPRDGIDTWTDFPFPLDLLEGLWTDGMIDNVLKTTDRGFKKGFTYKRAFLYKLRSNKEGVIFRMGLSPKELANDVQFLGIVNLKTGKTITEIHGLAKAIQIAKKGGGQVVVPHTGQNRIYHGSSFGLGFAPAYTSDNNSGGGTIGAVSSNAKAEDENCIRVAVFTIRNGRTVALKTQIEGPKKSVIPAKGNSNDHVNPQVLQEVSGEKPN